jgi:8-oxo-dGTP pyrophosphatase MutT (NUDIX family)
MNDTRPLPADPVPAATILLLREGPNGYEVFMQKRYENPADRFSGALIFPGGKVDAQDRDSALRDYSRVPAGIDDIHFTLRIAAIREAFEECGVLLARPRGESALVSAARLATLQTWRERLNASDATLAQFVREEELELACDQLVYFANWITPAVRMKRFDTHFYLAPAPHDHELQHDGYESTDSLWATPEAALAAGRENRFNILFPTRSNLEKLALSATLQTALDTAAASTIIAVTPQVEKRVDGIYVTIPAEAGYPNCVDKREVM